jgi:hypothetical protein
MSEESEGLRVERQGLREERGRTWRAPMGSGRIRLVGSGAVHGQEAGGGWFQMAHQSKSKGALVLLSAEDAHGAEFVVARGE